jgi:hypothetical protein
MKSSSGKKAGVPIPPFVKNPADPSTTSFADYQPKRFGLSYDPAAIGIILFLHVLTFHFLLNFQNLSIFVPVSS